MKEHLPPGKETEMTYTGKKDLVSFKYDFDHELNIASQESFFFPRPSPEISKSIP